MFIHGFPYGSVGKESTCKVRDLDSIPGWGRSPGEGKGYPFQYSGLVNSVYCMVHGVVKSWTRLGKFHIFLLSVFWKWNWWYLLIDLVIQQIYNRTYSEHQRAKQMSLDVTWEYACSLQNHFQSQSLDWVSNSSHCKSLPMNGCLL